MSEDDSIPDELLKTRREKVERDSKRRERTRNQLEEVFGLSEDRPISPTPVRCDVIRRHSESVSDRWLGSSVDGPKWYLKRVGEEQKRADYVLSKARSDFGIAFCVEDVAVYPDKGRVEIDATPTELPDKIG